MNKIINRPNRNEYCSITLKICLNTDSKQVGTTSSTVGSRNLWHKQGKTDESITMTTKIKHKPQPRPQEQQKLTEITVANNHADMKGIQYCRSSASNTKKVQTYKQDNYRHRRLTGELTQNHENWQEKSDETSSEPKINKNEDPTTL